MPTKSQDLVKQFCQDEKHAKNLIYVEDIDTFGLYDEEKGVFKIISEEHFQPYVYDYLLENTEKNLSKNLVKDIVSLVKWKAYRKIKNINSNYISIKDKLLNLETFEFEEFSKDKVAFHHIECDIKEIESMKSTPLFTKFLEDVLVTKDMQTDNELITVAQEMMGYYLLNTMEGQCMFFLNGEGANGKSVLLNILRAMVGDEFCSAMSIETITTNRFAPAGLIGKKVNICSEDESQYIKSDKFKALVSGDPIQVDRKFGSMFLLYPTTKYIYATNNLPTFNGVDHGLLRRINIIPFLRRISEAEKDTTLDKKIIAQELPGIISWALIGAKRLKENKFKFSPSKQMDEVKEEFTLNLSASMMFIKDGYEESDSESDFIPNDNLYLEFKLWCERNGKKAPSSPRFLKEIIPFFKEREGVVRYSADDKRTVRGRFIKRKEL